MKSALNLGVPILLALVVGCTARIDALSSGGSGSSARSGTGSDGPGDDGPAESVEVDGVTLEGEPIYSRFVRLTHTQWERSVQDLLELSALPGLSDSFTTDPPGPTFSNNERSLFVTSGLWADYQRAAETLGDQIAGDSALRAKIASGTTSAAAFVQTFGRRAFRRPLSAAEQTRYETLFNGASAIFNSGDAFADGVKLTVETMLQSPHFLYRTELGADGGALDGYEVASKLSFLLRNTTPSDALLDAAASGAFDAQASIHAQAQALLDDMSAHEVFERFHTELFGLNRYAGMYKDKTVFPTFSDSLSADLEQADKLFFDAIFSQGQGLTEILLSPTAFVNDKTAPFYGLSAAGSGFTQVTLGADRPGFFTRLGFLAFNATSLDPDPIHRGVDINRKLLGLSHLAPPPGVIPSLPTPQPGQTNRERVDAHTGEGTCGATCHGTVINPIGFAFENFDAMGQVRSMDNGKPIDTSGTYEAAAGTWTFSGAPELLAYIAGAPQTHASYAARLAEFCLTRDVASTDADLVTALEQTSVAQASIKDLVLAIIDSPAFSQRVSP